MNGFTLSGLIQFERIFVALREARLLLALAHDAIADR